MQFYYHSISEKPSLKHSNEQRKNGLEDDGAFWKLPFLVCAYVV